MNTPTSDTLRWQKAADALAPDQSLQRVAANAKFVIATVTVVGTALTALGLVSVDQLSHRPLARAFALIAIVLTLAAVLMALRYLVLRSRAVALDNLLDVEAWYKEELGLSIWVRAAGWLLFSAVLCAGLAGLTAAVTADPWYQVGLQSSGLAGTTSLSATASANGVSRGALAQATVTAKDAGGVETVVLRTARTADSGGTARIDATVPVTGHYQSFTIVLTSQGQQRATMTVPAT
ncbi:hypothetical protein ACFXDE_36825 [Kitasatospora sp. NPDC059408]|uniref:hypothetical protein n=1 Tax=Kitasatospora sp. NPDC059408 TaxID=3346823 RepID=UPI003679C38F